MADGLNGPISKGQTDLLRWEVYRDRQAMGQAAAIAMSKEIKQVMKVKDHVNIVFATAPSQNEFLSSLIEMRDLEWSRINAFHQDEYIGLSDTNPQSFSAYFHEHIVDRVKLGRFFLMNGNADPDNECQRYSQLLKKFPTDICCGGIGENGHIAFNDPHVADFSDPLLVKKVNLDETCRQQQIHDGCFDSIQDVPDMAMTLTVPALMRAPSVLVVVPSQTKAEAVKMALSAPISEDFPATVYRRHPSAALYLDTDAARLIL